MDLNFRDGQATYARNKSDLYALGKNINDLINRNFAGGEKVKKAYVMAFKSYENAINKLSEEVKEKFLEHFRELTATIK